MKVLLKKIKLHNFLSHEETTINFSESEKSLIDGASGAGKSSIFDAIIWCLYAQGRAGNTSLIRKGSKKSSVTLELTKKGGEKGDTIIITRSINSAGKHTLGISMEGVNTKRIPITSGVGIRGLQEYIDKDIIGASWLLFVNSVAYVQGNNDSFVAQSAKKRKELLLEIVKAEDYKKYYEGARQKLSDLNNDVNVSSGQIDSLSGVLEALGDIEKQKKLIIDTILNKSTEVSKLQPKLQELDKKKAELCSTMEAMVFITENLKTAISNRDFVKNMLYERNQDIAEKDKLKKLLELGKDFDKKLGEEKKTLTKLQASLVEAMENDIRRNLVVSKKPTVDYRVEEIGRLMVKLNKIEKEPICPSGEKCPYSGDHLGQIKEIKKQLSQLDSLIEADKRFFKEWEVELKSLPKVVILKDLKEDVAKQEAIVKMLEERNLQLITVQKELDNIAGIESKIPELKKSLKEKNQYVKDIEKKKVEAEKIAKPEELVKIDKELGEKKEKLKIAEDEIVRSKTLLENIEKDEIKSSELKEQISTLKKEISKIKKDIEKVSLVKMAFGSKGGIETLVIDYLLPKLEDRINNILSKLSDFRVRLDTQRTGADGENQIEGLFITIINEMNEEMPFEAYSGGEKLKISVAISEALATLQKVGFRLFDESIFALDENSLESFTSVMEDLLNSFPQLVMISHIQEIKDLFPKKINIKKTNNISRVE